MAGWVPDDCCTASCKCLTVYICTLQAAPITAQAATSARPPAAGRVRCVAAFHCTTRQRLLRKTSVATQVGCCLRGPSVITRTISRATCPLPVLQLTCVIHSHHVQATFSWRQPLAAWLPAPQLRRTYGFPRSLASSAVAGAADAPPAPTADRVPLTREAVQAAATCSDVLQLAAGCPAQQLSHLAARMVTLHFDSMTPPRASLKQLAADRAALAALLDVVCGQLAQLDAGTCLRLMAATPAMQAPASMMQALEQQAVQQVEALSLQRLCAFLLEMPICGPLQATPAAVLDALRKRLVQALPQAAAQPEHLAVLLCSGSQLGLLGDAEVQAAAQVAAGMAPEQLADTIAECGLSSRRPSVELTDVLRDAALAVLAAASPEQTALLVHSWSALGGQLGKAEDRKQASKACKGAQLLLGVKPGSNGQIEPTAEALLGALSALEADGSWQTSGKAHQMVVARTLQQVLPKAAPHDVARLLVLWNKMSKQVSGALQLQVLAEAALIRCLPGAGAQCSVMSSQETLDILQAWVDCGWQLSATAKERLPGVFRHCVAAANAAQLTQLVQSCSALRMELSDEAAMELGAALVRNQESLSTQQVSAVQMAALDAGWSLKDMNAQAALEPALIRLHPKASPSDVAKLLQAWCKSGFELDGQPRDVAAKSLMRSLPGKARGTCMSADELADFLSAAGGRTSELFGKPARCAVRAAVMELLPAAPPSVVAQLLCGWKEPFRRKLKDAASAAVLVIICREIGEGGRYATLTAGSDLSTVGTGAHPAILPGRF